MLMSHYQDGRRHIRDMDRDDRLAQDGALVCAHFGCVAPEYQWDHLIPRSRLNGESIPLNQVRSCPRCNASRGNKDLMTWHRQNKSFPSLGVLRRYLKLCYFYSKQRGLLDERAEDAVADGLPFDPISLPRKFPAVDLLVWDYAYQGQGRP